jgi:peptide/nickel transport system substrate-binding protein
MKKAAVIGLVLLYATGMAEAKTLRVATISPPVSFGAPYARDEGGYTRPSIYDALTLVTRQGELKPALAEAWVTENPTTWVFTLRPGVVFSNGEPFNAKAAASALRNLIDPAQRWPRALDVTGIARASARDALTLEVVTAKPDPLLARKLNMVPIPAPQAWNTLGAEAFAKSPVGTGPYKVVSWNSAHTKLEAVPTSWRKAREITKVETTITPDASARVKALLSGRVDVAMGLGPDDIEPVESNGYTIRITPMINVSVISYRTVRDDASPLKDVRVRHALNYAVDRDAIVKQIMAGTTRVASQGVVPGTAAFNPDIKPYPYDPAKAKALLAEAGYPNGFPLTISVYSGLLPNDTTMFQKVAQDLNAIGVKTELRAMTFADYARRLFNGDWAGIDAFSNGWLSIGLGDPMRAIDQFSCGYNAPFFCEPSMMPKVEAVRSEMDAAKREELMRHLMQDYRDAGAALWLVEFSSIIGLSPQVENFDTRSDGILYENITLKPLP